ncbi:hypothetical protein EDB92DRAFT_1814117 [Lactarius akahatsu]|uniref:Uncharacterized protein n=1 Tax=Lactarius akahatsu TaxID=416441 RepID=A0AAD4LKS1_9AGAM|nr:hypothetical protein EDB92DRAFT_1814117 [Lactarius akahatsu]
MPLSLPSMSVAIVCDGEELETYDVKQEGMSSLTAFIASEAGKQFKITYSNNLANFDLVVYLYIDGQLIRHACTRARSSDELLGPYNSARSVLPFKFQELQLVELKAYRCHLRHITKAPSQFMHEGLHKGRVSELSKKVGWHHVATGDEILVKRPNRATVDYLDSWTGPPYASIKISYRPRELLRAQGIIPGNDENRQGSPINHKKRAREDGSPGPSRSRQNIKIKREDLSGDARAERMRALQAELDALKAAEQSDTSVKRELRSPSPIVVKYSGEVVDLTLDD